MGQASHQIMSRINVMAKGYKILGIEPLPEAEALSRGIDIFSEIFIFAVGGSIMVFEYARSEAKSAQKAAAAAKAEADYRAYIENRFVEAEQRIVALESRLVTLEGPKLTKEIKKEEKKPETAKISEKKPEAEAEKDEPPPGSASWLLRYIFPRSS